LRKAADLPAISQPTIWFVTGFFCASAWWLLLLTFQVPLSLWQKVFALSVHGRGCPARAFVLIPGIGKDVNGARRWLPLGFANLQPSELMKLFAVLYAADYTVRKINVMHDLKQAFPADVWRDGHRRHAAPQRARLWRFCRHYLDCDGLFSSSAA
jgi:cell division protein FtsW (lipid II flippase)